MNRGSSSPHLRYNRRDRPVAPRCPMSEPDQPVESRGTFMPLLIGTLVAALLLGLLHWSLGALVVLGLIHYLMWGRSLSEEVAGEREEMELLERDREQKPQNWTF